MWPYPQFLQICSDFLKKALMKNFIFCALYIKKVFLKKSQNSQQNVCSRVSVLIKLLDSVSVCNLIWKKTRAQVFFCEFCEVFKDIYL